MPRSPRSPRSRSAGAKSKTAHPRLVLDELFAHPPLTERELLRRIDGLEPDGARRALVQQLETRRLNDQDVEIFMAVFGHLGVGREAERLAAIVLRTDRDLRARAYACGLLANEDAAFAEKVMQDLDPDDRVAIMEVPFVDMLVWVQADDKVGEQLGLALEGIAPELQEATFERLDEHRRRVGTSATSAYAHTLRQRRAPILTSRMLHVVVEEADEDGIALVEELRDDATDPQRRRMFQAAVLRMRTQAIEPTRVIPEPRGYAYLSSCDNQADFVVLGCFENPDRTLTVADVCLRLGGDTRGSFVMLRQSPKDVQGIVKSFRRVGGDFVRIPLPSAARLVLNATQEPRARRRRSTDCDATLRLFRRAAGGEATSPPCIAPAWDAPLESVRRLLARPEYKSTWFFTSAELHILGDGPPPKVGDTEALTALAAKLESRARRCRLAEMASHMATWHAYRKEADEAALCATLAQLTERNFSTSPLVLALLEKSLLPRQEDCEDPSGTFGDVPLRDLFRTGFFQDVAHPKGRDLARLDFAEAAFVCIDSFPFEHQPDRSPRMAAAFAIANVYVSKTFVSKSPPDIAVVIQRIQTILVKHCGADKGEAYHMAVFVFSKMASFFQDVCGHCSVRCIEHTRAKMEKAFFSEEHPAAPTVTDGNQR